MKATLIFLSNDLNLNFQEQAVRDDNIGFIPPLCLMTVAGILEQQGVEVEIMDMDAEKLSYDQALERVNKFSPDILGFTLTTYGFGSNLSWIRQFKKTTGLPIIVGGPHTALYPVETMSHPEIDYLIVGEAEIPLPPFIKAFQTDKNFAGIKSLGYRDENGDVILDRTRQTIADMDEVPLSTLHLIKNELYANVIAQKKKFTAMLSSRGCPYKCTFCDQKTPPYRCRSAENFVGEIERNYHQFGIRDFDIYDSTFTANKKRVKDICAKLEELKLDIGFTIRSRVDSVDYEVLDALKRAGCHTVFYGVESSDAEILKRMRKEITPEQIRDTITYTKKIGIGTLGYFMLGYPGETAETMEATLQFAMDLPLDYAQFNVLTPYPDTEIYEYYQHNGMEEYWGKYTKDPSKEHEIQLMGTELTLDEVNQFVYLAYRRFYFRPSIILRRLSKVTSFNSFFLMARAAVSIFGNSLKWGSGNSLFSWQDN